MHLRTIKLSDSILSPQVRSGERKQNMVFIYLEFLSVSQLGECARGLGYGTKP